MFNRCFQLFGFPKDDCDWKIRKAKVQCCTEPTPVWNILKHWNHHESSGIVVIHQVASYELALRDRLKLRPEVAAVFFSTGKIVTPASVWNPSTESKMHWKAGSMFSEALGGFAHQCGRTIPLKGGATESCSREPIADGGAGREFKCTNQIKPALFNKFYVFLGCMLKKEPEPQVRVHRISW